MIRATAIYRPRGSAGQFIAANVTPGVRASVQASAELIAGFARELCPVETGRLRDSISVEMQETDKTITATVGPRGVPYDAYVEYGTGKRGSESEGAGPGPYTVTKAGMPAQPYMRPAVDQARDSILDLFQSNIGLGAVKR